MLKLYISKYHLVYDLCWRYSNIWSSHDISEGQLASYFYCTDK
jgi:hypothetical protein